MPRRSTTWSCRRHPEIARVESLDTQTHGRDMPVGKIERHGMGVERSARVDTRAAFDHHDIHPALRQVRRQRTPYRSGADDANIVSLRRHISFKPSNAKDEYTPEFPELCGFARSCDAVLRASGRPSTIPLRQRPRAC